MAERLAAESLAVVRSFHANQNRRYRKAGAHDMVVRVDGAGRVDTPPTSPGRLLAQPGADGSNTLLWKPASDDRGVRAYRVYRNGKAIATVRGTTWFVDRGAGGEPHDYAVRAVDTRGTTGRASKLPLRTRMLQQRGAQQAEAGAAAQPAAASGSAQAAAGASQLAAPRYTTAKTVGSDGFQLGWTAVPGAVAYGIYQAGKLIGHVSDPSFAARVTKGDATVVEVDSVDASGARSARTPAIALRLGPDGVQAAPVDAGRPATTAPATQPAQAGPLPSISGSSPAPVQPVAAPRESAPSPAPGTGSTAATPSTTPPPTATPAPQAQPAPVPAPTSPPASASPPATAPTTSTPGASPGGSTPAPR